MSKKYLIAGLIVILLLMLPFGYNYFNKKETVHRIEISNQTTEN